MTTPADTREKVARIIDRWSFGVVGNIYHPQMAEDGRAAAFRKADEIILALQPDAGLVGENRKLRDLLAGVLAVIDSRVFRSFCKRNPAVLDAYENVGGPRFDVEAIRKALKGEA